MAMIDLLRFVLVLVGVSSVLYLTYMVSLRYRCKYNLARIYLLSIPVVALLSVSVTFNVIPLPNNTGGGGDGMNVQAQTIGTLIDDLVEEVQEVQEAVPPVVVAQEVVVPLTVPTQQQIAVPVQQVQSSDSGVLDVVLILGVLYLLGVVVRLILVTTQVRRILSIKRWATRERFNDVTLYRSGLIETPFSFIRNIFIDRRVEGDKLKMVVQHEISHIENRHYLDKNIIELMCVVMWFNPIVWCVRNELGAIHEFQADNNLIEDGVDVKTYQHYLFEEIMGESPSIANGFNHSLIKKRMVMMMRNGRFKNTVAKTSLAVVSVVSIFMSVSFRHAEAESMSNLMPEPMPVAAAAAASVVEAADVDYSVVVSTDIFAAQPAAIVIDENLETLASNASQEVAVHIDSLWGDIDSQLTSGPFLTFATTDVDPVAAPVGEEVDISSLGVSVDDESLERGKYAYGEYYLSQDQVRGIPDYIALGTDNSVATGVVGIKVTETETFVDYMMKPSHYRGWLSFSERTFLRDKATNDMYKVRRVVGGIPLGQRLVVMDRVNQYICFTFVFPPLGKNVKMVDLIELQSEISGKSYSKSGLTRSDLNVEQLKERKLKSVRIIK